MKHKGFTLVELAIVMTIIGLLIGGILKGQELLENARVTSTIAQVKSFDAAITGFRDIYDGLPGDLRDAGNKIPGCNENCTPVWDASNPPGNNAGDGFIGVGTNLGSFCDNPGQDGMGSTETEIPPLSVGSEGYLMWIHLLKTNLISGVSDIGMREFVLRSFGTTDPAAKVGGGFWPGTGLCSQSGPVHGLALALTTRTHGLADATDRDSFPVGGSVLTPSRAAQIDRKIDDGRPQSGTVIAVGDKSGFCDTADNEYNEQVSTKDCDLIIGVQQ